MYVFVCMCGCVGGCVRACVRACLCACVPACVFLQNLYNLLLYNFGLYFGLAYSLVYIDYVNCIICLISYVHMLRVPNKLETCAHDSPYQPIR